MESDIVGPLIVVGILGIIAVGWVIWAIIDIVKMARTWPR